MIVHTPSKHAKEIEIIIDRLKFPLRSTGFKVAKDFATQMDGYEYPEL